ncbi:hypothetical protein HWV62_20176, partial [Athelia sp. TMB]
LKPLPPQASTSNRIYYYGWTVEEEWVERQAPQLNRLGAGLNALRVKSGYRHLHGVNGYVNDNDASPDMDVGPDGRKVSFVIMVAANWVNESLGIDLYNRRPTVRQMERLVELFGRKPSWHMDGRPKRYFGDYPLAMHLTDR